MCAMALVHSRVRRVFFAHPDPTHGMLGKGRPGRLLHAAKTINHRYTAFCLCDKGLLGDRGLLGVEEVGEGEDVEPPKKRSRE